MDSKLYLCLSLLIASFQGYKSACTMTEDDLDKCMYDSMFFGSDIAIVPADDAQMTQHCEHIIKGTKCMREYSATCLTGFPQQVFNIILTNMGRHLDKRCKQPKERAEFIENVKCFLPKEEKMVPLNTCSDKHTKYMELASGLGPDDHIQGACCGYHIFRHCIVENVKHICSADHSQYWDDIFDEVASEAIAFACAEYDTKSKCEKLLPADVWAKFKHIEDATDPAVWHHGYKTPIKFIMDMIKKFHMNTRK